MRSFFPLPRRTWSVRRSVFRSGSSMRQSSVRRMPRVKQFQHGPVAHAQRIGHVRHGEQPFDFRQRQHVLRQPFFHAGQFHLAGRVVQDDILPGQPAEEIFEHAQPVALRAPAQPLPVGLGATPEPALKTFQDGPGDLAGACQVALCGPRQKNFQGVASAFQGAFGVVACAERFKIGVAPQRQRVGGAAVEVVRLAGRCRRVAPACAGRAFRRRQSLWVRP